MEGNGLDIIWIVKHFRQFKNLCATSNIYWGENETNKWCISVNLKENYGFLYLERCSANDPDEISGSISAQGNNNDLVCNLGSFETRIADNNTFREIPIQGFNKILFLQSVKEESLTLHIQLRDVRRRYVTPIQYFLRSKLVEEKSSFEWIIQSQKDENGLEFFSQHTTEVPRSFTDFISPKIYRMRITLCLDFIRSQKANIEICFSPQLEFSTIINLKIKIKDEEGNAVSIIELYCSSHESIREDLTLDSEIVKNLKTKKDLYYTDGKMTLMCEVSSFACSTTTENVNYNIFYRGLEEDTQFFSNSEVSLVKPRTSKDEDGKNSFTTLNESLCMLMNEMKFCDVTLRAENKTYPCHKAVLCARSPVFLAMFENDMREKDTGVVDITDVTSNTLDVFLKMLYTDTVEDLGWESTKELYVAANKYLVSEVVKRSSDMLKAQLSTSNISDFLILVDDYDDQEMLEFGLQYFIKHAKEIIQSDEWKTLMSNRPCLIGTLFQKLSLSKHYEL